MLRDERASSSLTLPVAIWLAPQLLSLVLSASRMPLSAHPPRPIESTALAQMSIVQIVATALFAPAFFRSIGATIAIVLVGAPMLQLAGLLSATPITNMLALYALSAGWIIALTAVCATANGASRLVVSALATFYALGGLALAYLHAEFAPERRVFAIIFGPALLALQIAPAREISLSQWAYVAGIPTLGGMIWVTRGPNPAKTGSVEQSGNSPANA